MPPYRDGFQSPDRAVLLDRTIATAAYLMLAPEPFFEPREPFSELHRIKGLIDLGTTSISSPIPSDRTSTCPLRISGRRYSLVKRVRIGPHW